MRSWAGLLLMAGLVACADADDEATGDAGPAAGGHGVAGIVVLDGAALAGRAVVPVEAGAAFRFVGLRFDADANPRLEARTRDAAGAWSPWRAVTVTWSEGPAYNGLLALESAAEALELRPAPGAALRFLALDLRTAPPPATPSAGATAVRGFALGPPGLVADRAAWGARADRCTDAPALRPRFATVHHTVTPNADPVDPALRLRQLQAYHVDVNGGCDLPYHLVVSADGRLWQGRPDERRGGAHTFGHDMDNVGVALLGDFDAAPPTTAALDGLARALRLLHDAHDLPLDAEHVRAHRDWPGAFGACPGAELDARLDDVIAAAPTIALDPPGDGPDAPPPLPPCPDGDGPTCGDPALGLSPTDLYDCLAGEFRFAATCEAGCAVAPDGAPDACRMRAPAECPAGEGTYCGGGVGLDPATLYTCAAGIFTPQEVCAEGCRPAGGAADACLAPPPDDPVCPDGEGLGCGAAGQDRTNVYRCAAGRYTREQVCAFGCLRGACNPSPQMFCPDGDGRYCGQDVGREADSLFDCADGVFTPVEACPRGCRGGACVAPPSCPDGDRDYCGGEVGRDAAVLYRCLAGAFMEVERCAHGCAERRCAAAPPPACPNGDGLYCGGPVGRDANTLYRCTGGAFAEVERCANGCAEMPAGTDDACAGGAPAGCPNGNGLYCGGPVGRDANTLYRCTDGAFSEDARCPAGCSVMPAGVSDACGGACASGNGLYCGGPVGLDQNRLYRCTNGAFRVEQECGGAGCFTAPPGQPDRCN